MPKAPSLPVLTHAALMERRTLCRACPSNGKCPRQDVRICFCDAGGVRRVERTQDPAANCLLGKWPAVTPDMTQSGLTVQELFARNTVTVVTPDKVKFRRLWAEIHDPTRSWTREWWASVLKRLPCGGCKKHTRRYAKAHPIPFGDDAACLKWGSTFHDDVNARLGKPLRGVPSAGE